MTEISTPVHFLREVRSPRYGRKIRIPAVEADGAIRDVSTALVVFRRLGIEAPLERFIALYLDRARRPVGFASWDGDVGEVPVYPATVMRGALFACAGGVLVAHGHPSGDPSPSAADRALTCQLVLAGSALGIPILDHLILGGQRHFSFKDVGAIEEARRAYENWRAACP